ncbi:DUF3967 domain-containing protein [Domibacillus aminovorans]|uniref:DUF3967 domain-containing protein n=1 Tax=Domibacillus aminovorans TaxID=29332 RepID=UPI001FD11FC4|nr:DUF3967 domain-containing protein [Domibacillus aminovorans]
MREELYFLRENAEKQEQFNQAMVTKMEDQQKYINDKLEARDRNLMQALNETQEIKKIMLAEKEEKEEKKKGFFARLFS